MNTEPEIHSVHLYKKIKFPLFRGDVWPFMVIYLLFGVHGMYFWMTSDPINIPIPIPPHPDASLAELFQNLPTDFIIDSIPPFWTLYAIPFIVVIHALFHLTTHWNMTMNLALCFRKSSLENNADSVLIIAGNPSTKTIVPLENKSLISTDIKRHSFRFENLVYDLKGDNQFNRPKLPIDLPIHQYLSSPGVSQNDSLQKLGQYGENRFIIPELKFYDLFLEHAVAPFFVFQIFCVILWCFNDSIFYSLLTFLLLILFEAILVNTRIVNSSILSQMSTSPIIVWVFRDSKWIPIFSHKLVPGDLIGLTTSKRPVPNINDENSPESQEFEDDLNSSCAVPCDVALLSGSCIVNEALLTGESEPQQKDAINVEDNSVSLDLSIHSNHILFSGTNIIQAKPGLVDPPTKMWKRTPFRGTVGYVLRTGFSTTQGSLLRTILFSSSQRAVVHSSESYIILFILFVFAVVASGYVLIKGIFVRNLWSLFIACTTILTSVVPPDLPIQLSMAVNASIQKLQGRNIFCTSPFRLPIAGKLNVCCFDKTGTLTSEDLVLSKIRPARSSEMLNPFLISDSLAIALASCHSLAIMKRELVGDPLEKAVLHAIGWQLSDNNIVSPIKSRRDLGRKPPGIGFRTEILKTYPFSSRLKRMSSVVHVFESSKLLSTNFFTKGAPEVIVKLLKNSSDAENIINTANQLSLQGYRVLACAQKVLPKPISFSDLAVLGRSDVEANLEFIGFICFRSLIKPTSKSTISELYQSGHKNVMITGDHPQTASFVAKKCLIIHPQSQLLFLKLKNNQLLWDLDGKSIPFKDCLDKKPSSLSQLFSLGRKKQSDVKKYGLIVTGATLKHLFKHPDCKSIFPHVECFARCSPVDKEKIVDYFKHVLGMNVLMAGDGTNDVGALKSAQVGVSLLNSIVDPFEDDDIKSMEQIANSDNVAASSSKKSKLSESEKRKLKLKKVKKKTELAKKAKLVGPIISEQERMMKRYMRRAKRMKSPAQVQLEKEWESEKAQIANSFVGRFFSRVKSRLDANTAKSQLEMSGPVKLGDASLTSPFTCKRTQPTAILDIIRQGRCTLVTTIQMYRILAINSLLKAYTLSVLELENIRFSDFQMTVVALIPAFLFFAISNARPAIRLSKTSPTENVTKSPKFILSVFGQFFGHLLTLLFLTRMATNLSSYNKTVDYWEMSIEFQPSLVNTVCFFCDMVFQISTFFINYRGPPYMEPISTNNSLIFCLIGSVTLFTVLFSGIIPQFNAMLQIVRLSVWPVTFLGFETRFSLVILTTLFVDIIFCFIFDRICSIIFPDKKMN